MRTMQVRLNTVRFLLFVLAIDNGLAIVHNRKVKLDNGMPGRVCDDDQGSDGRRPYLTYHGAHEMHEQQAPLPEILIRSCKADQSPITEESKAWRARTSWNGTGSPIVFHSSIYIDQTLISSSVIESLFSHLLLRGRSDRLLPQRQELVPDHFHSPSQRTSRATD